MKIALINGSPKVNNSASGALLADMKEYFSKEHEIMEVRLHTDAVPEETLAELKKAEAWVFAFPLYMDGIPGHLLSCLVQMESLLKDLNIQVYGIVNCGFYEGVQAEIALKILQNWCLRAGISWGSGVGVGGGGSLGMMPKTPPGKGPTKTIDHALQALAEQTQKSESGENHYVSVGMPRILYKMAAQMGWRQMIRHNGGKARDLKKRL